MNKQSKIIIAKVFQEGVPLLESQVAGKKKINQLLTHCMNEADKLAPEGTHLEIWSQVQGAKAWAVYDYTVGNNKIYLKNGKPNHATTH